jgi:colicin import membrane protein
MGRRMRASLTISTVGHLALLVWGLVTFASKPFAAAESVAVDMISDAEFSQIMAGSKTAPRADAPKPIVDKVADEAKPVKDPAPKVVEKPEILATAETAPPPKPPETKPPEPKPAQAEVKPDKAEPIVDPIAEALKREEAKKKQEAKKLEEAKKKEEARKREEAKKREQEKYDPAKIESRLALLDKRAPQRQAALGAILNDAPSLGAPGATAMTLSMNELDALRARLRDCWDVPVGVRDARDLVVTVRIQFKKDGSLITDPTVVNRSPQPVFQVASESAVRAIRKCAPFSFLPPAKYEAWKDVEVNFDPREMFGG